MKTFLSSILAAVILFASPTAGFAAKTKKSAELRGEVTEVNGKARTITITQKKTGQSRTLHVRHASITVNKHKHKDLSDVKVGMHVRMKHGKKGHLHIAAKSHSGKKKKKPGAAR